MRLMDVVMAFPALLLAISIVTIPGPGLTKALRGISITFILQYARLMRASVLSLKELEFVTAGQAVGAGPLQILFVHILPNAVTPIIVQGTPGIGTAILDAATPSFPGPGAQPPTPEWGQIQSDSRNYVFASPHLVFFPGTAIIVTVPGFNLLGDGMRDALDPRLNRNWPGRPAMAVGIRTGTRAARRGPRLPVRQRCCGNPSRISTSRQS